MAILSKGSAAASQKMGAETKKKRETAGGWGKTPEFSLLLCAAKTSLQSSMDEKRFHCYEWSKWDVNLHSFLAASRSVVWGFCASPHLPSSTLTLGSGQGFCAVGSLYECNSWSATSSAAHTEQKGWKVSAKGCVAIPTEGESWVLALWHQWPCQHHRQGGLVPTQGSTSWAFPLTAAQLCTIAQASPCLCGCSLPAFALLFFFPRQS